MNALNKSSVRSVKLFLCAMLFLASGGILHAQNVPAISSFNPLSGSSGTSVSIAGTNFDSTTASNIVYFGAVRATVASASTTNLTVSVPISATYAPITVTVNGLTACANQAFMPTFSGDGGGINASSFAPRQDLASGSGPIKVVIADLDGDGKPDLVVANDYNNSISLYRNISTNGSLTADSFALRVDLATPPGSYSPYGMVVADVDGDGKLDIIASDYDNSIVSVYRNTCTPGNINTNAFAMRVEFATGAQPQGVEVRDMDGDGRPDLLVANVGDGTVSILRNTSVVGSLTTDSFAAKVDIKAGSGCDSVAVGDLDGDGKPDVVTANAGSGTVSVFRNVSSPGSITTSSFAPKVDFTVLDGMIHVAIGDLDGDGKPDISVLSYLPSTLSVFRNTSTVGTLTTDSFAPRIDYSLGGRGHTTAIGDLDGDGKPDLAVVTELDSLFSVFRNVSTPGSFTNNSFAARVDFSTGWNAWGVSVGDLDGDGRPDVVFGDAYDATISIYQNAVPFAGPPVIITQPVSQTVVSGNNANFSVIASGSTVLSYQWWFGGAITGATNSTLTLANVQLGAAGSYFVVVTNLYGSATSSNAVLTVTNQAPYIITQPQSNNVVVGASVTFTVSAGGSKPLSYRWRFNGTNISNATNASYTIQSVQTTNAGVYSVVVTNPVNSITSSNAVLTVTVLPTTVSDDFEPGIDQSQWSAFGSTVLATNYGGYVSPSNSLWFGGTGSRFATTRLLNTTAGGPIEFNIRIARGASSTWETADLPGKGIVLEYSTNQGTNWTEITRYDTAPYTNWTLVSVTMPLGSKSPATLFRWRQLSNSGSSFDHWALDDVNVGPHAPQISTQPTNVTVMVGQNATFNVLATGTAPLKYRWSLGGTNLPGATNATLTLTNVQPTQAGNYAVQVTNLFGSVLSSNAVLTVNIVLPSITAQPTNQTVTVGQSATFSVTATGGAPLRYQWRFNATGIGGATNSLFTLANVQLTNAGNYSVQVTNIAGIALSSNAVLTVNTPGCVTPPSGLVGWWAGESNALDTVGVNHGALQNGISFGGGEVGQAFLFNTTNAAVKVPASSSLNVGLGSGFTIECWVNPSSDAVTGQGPLVEWNNGTGWGAHFFINYNGGPGNFYANVVDTGGVWHIINSGAGVVTSNVFQHLAVTYDKATGLARLYRNGAMVAQQNLGSFTPYTSFDLYLGRRVGGDFVKSFSGLLDEVSIYSRALTSNEIASIHDAAVAGKCPPAPTPPAITTQPTNRTVVVGQSTTFSVTATGSPTLRYQWRFNGTNIVGATNTLVTLSNVQMAQAGNYSVLVSNLVDSVISSNAVLTVNTPVCVAPPSGLVGWWAGEANASDSAGLNNGILEGGLSFTNGEVGQAFYFNNTNADVKVPASASLNVGTNSGFTIECWINPADTTYRPLAEWNNGTGTWGTHFYVISSGFAANIVDSFGTWHSFISSTGIIVSNTWQHVALTYDKTTGVARFYRNGLIVTQQSLGSFTPQTSYDLYLGRRPPTGGEQYSYKGLLDEMSLYNRALTSNEITAIYNVGASGKCPPVPTPPAIITQPTNQTVIVGQSATFSVTATGSPTLRYQWRFNGTNIAAATNASLTLSNVQMAQAGNYSVRVTNLVDSVISSNATLTVNFAPATIQVVNTNGMGGTSIEVPVIFVANGNENALSFSLSFDTQRMTYSDIVLGSSLPDDASFLPNTSQAGIVGVSLLLPTGHTFAAGSQEVVRVIFDAPILTGTQTVATAVSFTNFPVNKLLSDINVHALPANFINGTVSLYPGPLEGDAIGRPMGDGFVDIFDWQQVGRFVAGLDTITNASEFQRVDCAPRTFLGDGQIKVTDWVQAGRYAAGLDSLALAGGPTSASVLGSLKGNAGVSGGVQQNGLGSRQVSVADGTVVKGLTITLPVNLEAQGNESALAFSLSFDPTVLRYVSASKGSAATSATLNVNTSQVASGKLAIALMLPAGSSHFAAGTREVAKVTFIAVSTATNYSLGFADQPALRSISDTNAVELTGTYVSSSVTINPNPTLSISKSGTNVLLRWPTWASDFTLQTADISAPPITWANVAVTLQTNGANVETTMPASTQKSFFRLQHP